MATFEGPPDADFIDQAIVPGIANGNDGGEMISDINALAGNEAVRLRLGNRLGGSFASPRSVRAICLQAETMRRDPKPESVSHR